jgi:hypothetical protein
MRLQSPRIQFDNKQDSYLEKKIRRFLNRQTLKVNTNSQNRIFTKTILIKLMRSLIVSN